VGKATLTILPKEAAEQGCILETRCWLVIRSERKGLNALIGLAEIDIVHENGILCSGTALDQIVVPAQPAGVVLG